MVNDYNFPVITMNRHRMGTDGAGITTLVALSGCPLACKYCINKDILNGSATTKTMTPQALLEEVMIDHCYFLYSHGGITFGGGESLLHSEAIHSFRQICPKEWNITVETSLNIPFEKLEPLLSDHISYIIDVKSMDSDIYQRYTDCSNEYVLTNLKKIINMISPENIMIKVPNIPEFTTPNDIENTIFQLEQMGFTKGQIVTMDYIV